MPTSIQSLVERISDARINTAQSIQILSPETYQGSVVETKTNTATAQQLIGEGGVTSLTQADYGIGAPQFLSGSGQAVPGGIEAKVIIGGLILNNRRNADRYLVRSISGLGDPDIRDAREVLPESHGEMALQAWYGGRTITITGEVQAGNLAKLRDMQQALRTSLIELEEQAVEFNRDTLGMKNYILTARKNVPMEFGEERQEASGFFTRPFMISLRASNPRWEGNMEEVITSTGATPRTLLPVNDGNFLAEPYFEINGPITNPVITNTTTGDLIKLNVTLASNVKRFISVKNRTIKDASDVNKFGELDITSSWITLVTGENTITLTGSASSIGTALTVKWRDTYL